MNPILIFVALVALFAPGAVAQSRGNLDTGWIPSCERSDSPAEYAFDRPTLTACSDSSCTTTVVAPTLQYHYRVTLRNTTSEWHQTSGFWLTSFWLFNAPGQPLYNAMAAQGCGVPEFFALLAPNDGLPGGPDEITFDRVVTFTPADGLTVWQLAASLFLPNARAGTAHRLWLRATHWWSFLVDGQYPAPGQHWPVTFQLETAEARMLGVVASS